MVYTFQELVDKISSAIPKDCEDKEILENAFFSVVSNTIHPCAACYARAVRLIAPEELAPFDRIMACLDSAATLTILFSNDGELVSAMKASINSLKPILIAKLLRILQDENGKESYKSQLQQVIFGEQHKDFFDDRDRAVLAIALK